MSRMAIKSNRKEMKGFFRKVKGRKENWLKKGRMIRKE